MKTNKIKILSPKIATTSSYDRAMIKALNNRLMNQTEFQYREIIRWFSKTFSVPLHDVTNGNLYSWEDIVQHYYEDKLSSMSDEQVIQSTIDSIPELATAVEEDNQAYADSFIEEQERTLQKKNYTADELLKEIDISYPDEDPDM